MTAPQLPAADDPAALAAIAASLARPLLVGLDVDGVLAPIVAHAADAALLPGMLDAVAELAARTPVAVVSGRTVEDLGRFGFPDHVEIFGLHGMERRAERTVELAEHEAARLRAAGRRWRPTPPTGPATGRGSRSSRRASCSTCARPIPTTAPARPTSCGARPRTSPAPTCCRDTASSSC